MTATATAAELKREPARILERVERGDTIVIEEHGLPICVMIPQPGKTSAAELARSLRTLPAAPEAADELESILQRMNDASRASYPD